MLFSQSAKRFAGAALALLLVCTLVMPGLTAGAEAPSAYSAQLNMQVDGQDLSVKLWADLENQVFAAQGEADVEGETLAQLGLFISQTAFALQDSMLLGGTYGVDLTGLAENLPGSVFAPGSGSVLALPQPLYDALLTNEEDPSVGIIGGADGPTSLFVAGSLTTAIMKSVNTKVAPGELVLDSGTIKTTETTITLDAKGMAKLAAALLNDLQENQDAMDALAKLLGVDSITPEDLADGDKLQSELEDALTQAGASFTASTALDKQTKALVSCSATWTYEGETLDVQAVPAAGRCTLVRSGADGSSSTTGLEVEEDTDQAYALRFYVDQDGQLTSQLLFRWDKEAGTYVLTTQNGDQTDELTGTIQTGENSLVITADTANGQALEGCSLTLRRDDPAQMPQFQDILSMSEDSILQVLHTAMTAAQEIFAAAA